jgi:ribosomal protein S18 acetylase RimI-like enzyme
MTSIQIVVAEASHLPDVTRLYIHLSEHHGALAPGVQRYQVESSGWQDYAEKKFDDPLAFLFVAVDGEEVVGFVGTALADKPWGVSYEIQTLIVDEDRRGRGIGTALLQYAETHAGEVSADGLRVDVLLQNEDARRFYERAGYSATSVRHAKPVQKN